MWKYTGVLERKILVNVPVDVVLVAAQTYVLGCTGTSRSSCHVFWLDALLNTCSAPEDFPATEEVRGILQVPLTF